jgi:hypothetical protein
MIRQLFAKTNHLGITNLNLPLVPLEADARLAGWGEEASYRLTRLDRMRIFWMFAAEQTSEDCRRSRLSIHCTKLTQTI